MRRLALSLASAIVACAPAKIGTKAEPSVTLAAPAARTDARPTSAPEPTAIPFPPPNTGIACRLSNRVLYSKGEAPLELCVAPGVCYLELTDAPVQSELELELATGTPPTALLQIREEGFEFRGLVDVARLELLTAKPKVVAGFVVPNVLYVAGAEPGKLHLAVELDATLRPASPVAIDLPCDAVTTYGSFIDHEQQLAAAGISAPPTQREVRRPSLPLSLTPGGPSVATVELDGQTLDAHEVRGASTRVAFVTNDGALVFGWVASSALGSPKPGAIGHGSSGHGDTWLVGPKPGLDQVCPEDVELLAQVGERVFSVGKLLAHARFRLGPRVGSGFYAVEPPSRLAERTRDSAKRSVEDVRLVAGTTLLLRRHDAAICGAP